MPAVLHFGVFAAGQVSHGHVGVNNIGVTNKQEVAWRHKSDGRTGFAS